MNKIFLACYKHVTVIELPLMKEWKKEKMRKLVQLEKVSTVADSVIYCLNNHSIFLTGYL